MRTQWSSRARRDLVRVFDFLNEVNPRAAKTIVRKLNDAVKNLPDHPYVGHRLEANMVEDVRSLIVGDYVLHYEVTPDTIFVVRIWHMREDR